MNVSITTGQAEAVATSGLRQRKKDSSRRAIEDAAWELFAEQGYDETSINDIAERANVAPARSSGTSLRKRRCCTRSSKNYSEWCVRSSAGDPTTSP